MGLLGLCQQSLCPEAAAKHIIAQMRCRGGRQCYSTLWAHVLRILTAAARTIAMLTLAFFLWSYLLGLYLLWRYQLWRYCLWSYLPWPHAMAEPAMNTRAMAEPAVGYTLLWLY